MKKKKKPITFSKIENHKSSQEEDGKVGGRKLSNQIKSLLAYFALPCYNTDIVAFLIAALYFPITASSTLLRCLDDLPLCSHYLRLTRFNRSKISNNFEVCLATP